MKQLIIANVIWAAVSIYFAATIHFRDKAMPHFDFSKVNADIQAIDNLDAMRAKVTLLAKATNHAASGATKWRRATAGAHCTSLIFIAINLYLAISVVLRATKGNPADTQPEPPAGGDGKPATQM